MKLRICIFIALTSILRAGQFEIYYFGGDRGGVLEWESPVFVVNDDGSFHLCTYWIKDPKLLRRGGKLPSGLDASVGRLKKYIAESGDREIRITKALHSPELLIKYQGKTLSIRGSLLQPFITSAGAEEYDYQVAELNLEEVRLWQSLPDEVRACLLRIKSCRTEEMERWMPRSFRVSLYRIGEGKGIPIPADWLIRFDAKGGDERGTDLSFPFSDYDSVYRFLLESGGRVERGGELYLARLVVDTSDDGGPSGSTGSIRRDRGSIRRDR